MKYKLVVLIEAIGFYFKIYGNIIKGKIRKRNQWKNGIKSKGMKEYQKLVQKSRRRPVFVTEALVET